MMPQALVKPPQALPSKGSGNKGRGEQGTNKGNEGSTSHVPEVQKGENKGSKSGSKGKGHKNAGDVVSKKVKKSVVK